MTPQELAIRLDGREYAREMSREEELQARDAGIVVVFGRSDDLVYLLGAIDDEVGAYNGTTLRLSRAGVPKNECDDDDCPYFAKTLQDLPTVEVKWGGPDDDRSWLITTDIPHARFTIMDDGAAFSDGIVFKLEDLPS